MKKVLTLLILSLLGIHSLQAVITEITVLDNGTTKIVELSDLHVCHKDAQQQAEDLKKIIEKNPEIPFLVEDPGVANPKEMPDTLNKENLTKAINSCARVYLEQEQIKRDTQLIGFTNGNNKNKISVDSHRPIIDILSKDKEDNDLVQEALALHQEIVDGMNSPYCQTYKQQHKKKELTAKKFGQFFLELKLLAYTEEYAVEKKEPVVFIWAGDLHIQKINKTLFSLGFINTKIHPIDAKNNDQKIQGILDKNDLKDLSTVALFDSVPVPNIKKFFEDFMPTINKKQ
jgi:hypothetical protein